MSLIEKIKALIKMESETPVENNFADFKVTLEVSGETVERIFRVESEIISGSTVEEVTEDGVVAVEDGTFILEDGSTITVVDSTITEVKEAVEEVPTDEDSTDTVEEDTFESKFTSVTADLVAKELAFEALTADLVAKELAFEALTADLVAKELAFTELEAEFEAYKKGTDVTPTPVKKRKNKKLSKDDKVKFFGK